MYKILYFTSPLDEKEFISEVERGISLVPEANDKTFKINRVYRGREYLNFGFLYVADPAMYHTFIGNNPDGSARINYKEIEGEYEDWADVEVEEEFLPSLIDFPSIRFYPAKISELGEEYSHNILCCRNFPPDLNPEELRDIFYCYSSAQDYPRIKAKIIPASSNSEEKRIIFVIFSPKTLDAQYALLMTKQIKIGNHTLRFSQSYKNPKKDFIKKNL